MAQPALTASQPEEIVFMTSDETTRGYLTGSSGRHGTKQSEPCGRRTNFIDGNMRGHKRGVAPPQAVRANGATERASTSPSSGLPATASANQWCLVIPADSFRDSSLVEGMAFPSPSSPSRTRDRQQRARLNHIVRYTVANTGRAQPAAESPAVAVVSSEELSDFWRRTTTTAFARDMSENSTRDVKRASLELLSLLREDSQQLGMKRTRSTGEGRSGTNGQEEEVLHVGTPHGLIRRSPATDGRGINFLSFATGTRLAPAARNTEYVSNATSARRRARQRLETQVRPAVGSNEGGSSCKLKTRPRRSGRKDAGQVTSSGGGRVVVDDTLRCDTAPVTWSGGSSCRPDVYSDQYQCASDATPSHHNLKVQRLITSPIDTLTNGVRRLGVLSPGAPLADNDGGIGGAARSAWVWPRQVWEEATRNDLSSGASCPSLSPTNTDSGSSMSPHASGAGHGTSSAVLEKSLGVEAKRPCHCRSASLSALPRTSSGHASEPETKLTTPGAERTSSPPPPPQPSLPRRSSLRRISSAHESNNRKRLRGLAHESNDQKRFRRAASGTREGSAGNDMEVTVGDFSCNGGSGSIPLDRAAVACTGVPCYDAEANSADSSMGQGSGIMVAAAAPKGEDAGVSDVDDDSSDGGEAHEELSAWLHNTEDWWTL